MKTKIEVQFQERNIDLDIYYQPEEGDIYYVATTKDGKELSNEEALKIEE